MSECAAAAEAISSAIVVLQCTAFGDQEIEKLFHAIGYFRDGRFEIATLTAFSIARGRMSSGTPSNSSLDDLRRLFARALRETSLASASHDERTPRLSEGRSA
jgi:hypothetical protein